jgi:glycosyltransferase 2 family protein
VTRLLGSRAARLAIAAGLTGYLLWKSDPAAIAHAALDASPVWLAWACGLVLIDRTLMAWRWLLLLRPLTLDAPPALPAVMRVFFVSTFLGTALPASIGADAVRTLGLRRHAVPGTTVLASVVMDRVLGVVSVLLLGIASVAWLNAPVPSGVSVVLILGGLVSVGMALVIFVDPVAGLAGRIVALLPGALLRRLTQGLLDAIRSYRHHHGVLGAVTVASVAVQVLRVLQAWCLGRSLGIDSGIALYFVTIPVILLIMLLPITVNGLGTGQAAFLWTFGAAGVPRPQIFVLSVLFIALGIIGNLPGGLLYLFGGDAPVDRAPARSSSNSSLS